MKINRLNESWLEDFITHHYPDDEVKSAIWDYVSGYTTSVNTELRSGRNTLARVVTSVLDNAFTDTLPKLDLYRTVDWDFMCNLFGITVKNIDAHIGDVIVDKGYMSTAQSMVSPWGSTWTGGELILHIVSDRPVDVVDVNRRLPAEDIDCEEQNEIILPRGSKLKIVGYKILKGRGYSRNGTYLLETEYINNI